MLTMAFATTIQAQECYQSTRSKGISLCNQGKGKESVKFFEAAKDCPDKPANNDLNDWIKRCSKKNDNTSSGSNKVIVETIGFVGNATGENGLTRNTFYVDEIGSIIPKLTIDNGTKSNKKTTISIIVKDPEGDMIEYNGNGQFTESKAVTLKPGYNEVVFTPIADYAESMLGTYQLEVWMDKKMVKSTSFGVAVRPTMLVVNGNSRNFEEPLSYDGGHKTFSVSSSTGGFKVKQKPSWVEVKSQDDASFTISYRRNAGKDTKTGKMAVYTDNEEKMLVIDLVQEANPKPGLALRIYKKASINFCLPNFSAKANNVIGSVIDYGVTDMPSMAYLEKPDYKTQAGFGVSFDVDIFFTDALFVQTGLGFQHYGVKNTFSNDQLSYNSNGTRFYLDYGCTEKYKLNYLQLPILAGYRLHVNSVSSVKFNAGFVLGFGLSAKCKLEGGYANCTLDDGRYGNSTFSGEVNLYNGKFSIQQNYSTGEHPSFTYSGSKTKPFKGFDFGLRLGVAYDFGSIEVDVAYTIGLSNIGNSRYFENADRVGGCLLFGTPIPSEASLYGYRQHLNNFQIGVGIWL